MFHALCIFTSLAVAIASPIGLSADLAALNQISLAVTALDVYVAALPSSGPATSAQLALFQTNMNNLQSAMVNAKTVMLANQPLSDEECGVTLPPIQEVFPDRFVPVFEEATVKVGAFTPLDTQVAAQVADLQLDTDEYLEATVKVCPNDSDPLEDDEVEVDASLEAFHNALGA